mgnify:CR=1 FL=1
MFLSEEETDGECSFARPFIVQLSVILFAVMVVTAS